jgi:c-SKI Smad4 binding domain/SKI/SNO/DAC family
MSDALHIHYAECSSAQLDTLKRRNILPMHIPRCGLITQTDAERLCAVLLHSRPEPCRYARAGDVRIPVSHECFGGCKGMLWPRDYTSPSSLCIECGECGGRLSTMQFVSHSHSAREDRICHWGFDATNWRLYMLLAEDATRMVEELPKMRKMLDDIKALFINSDSSEVFFAVI